MSRLDGKVALVTGAARGQGEAEASPLVLVSDESSYCTGAELLIDGGAAAGQSYG